MRLKLLGKMAAWVTRWRAWDIRHAIGARVAACHMYGPFIALCLPIAVDLPALLVSFERSSFGSINQFSRGAGHCAPGAAWRLHR